MNAISQSFGPPGTPVIPDNAPFSAEQRAWLNGFFAGLYGGGSASPANASLAPAAPAEDFPWHDPAHRTEGAAGSGRGPPLPRA
jgi:sulfite reductase (NADPH) flavoprotein alpha-component